MVGFGKEKNHGVFRMPMLGGEDQTKWLTG